MHSRKRFGRARVSVFLYAIAALLSPLLCAGAAAAGAGDDATLLRVFLKDGTSLVSFGEPARTGDRVVFSMPTAATPNPPLHLVTIAVDRVDWDRTERYATSARAARYLESRAELDYSALSNRITDVLNQVTREPDSVKRLALAEEARKALSEWPAAHFNYRQTEVQQMLSLLDEAIADLRAANGADRFALNLLTFTEPPPTLEPLLPPLTTKEAIEMVLTASRVVDTVAERQALLSSVLVELDRSAASLPPEFVTSTRSTTQAKVFEEQRVDRAYQSLSARIIAVAERQARAADVRGLERLITRVGQRDRELGGKRPETVASLIGAVKSELDAARRLQLARDRWALREPALRAYGAEMNAPLAQFRAMAPLLESIKSLAGSSPAALTSIERGVTQILLQAAIIVPPDELQSAHALLISAVQLARNAASIRREAVMDGNIARAWDASSAAAGALMLGERARTDIETMLRPPQLR